MEELKPCPFCGGRMAVCCSIAEIECTTDRYDETHYGVVCDYTDGGCGSGTGRGYLSPEEAIEAWNRRAI